MKIQSFGNTQDKNIKYFFASLSKYKFLPLSYIFLIWIAFSFPYFFQGKVPYPSTYQVNHFKPWSTYEKYWGPVKNGAMPDLIDQIYPWKHFVIESWKRGEVPLWNPYNFSGNPHLANFQSAALTPFNLLYFILPFIDGWSIVVLAQPLLAGLFMYLLLREFKISKIGSLTGSVSFMFCGFIVVWMAYGTLAMAIAILPLSIYAVERFYIKKDFLSLLILSLCLPVSFFSGHFQTSLYMFLFLAAFVIYKFFVIRNIRSFGYLIFFILAGVFLSMPQLLPTVEFYLNSARSEIFIKGGGIPFVYLVTMIAPDFFGNPVTGNDWFGYYAEFASFVGIIPLLLCLYSFTNRRAISFFFIIAAFVSLAAAIDSPLLPLLGSLKIPVLSTSTPSRIVVLFSFSIAVLAGFGLDRLLIFIKTRQYRRMLWPIIFISVIVVDIWLYIILGKPLEPDKINLALRNFVLPTGFFGIILIFILISFFKQKMIVVVSLLLLLIASFDSFRFANKWMPFDSRDLVFADLPVISALQKNAGNSRAYGNMGAQIETYYGVSSLEGYDPLYIGRYGDFIESSSDGKFASGARSVVKLNRVGVYTDRVLDILGVGIIFHPVGDTNQSWAYPVWKDWKRYSKVYQDDKFEFYHNNKMINRATLYYSYEVVSEPKDIIKRFYSNDFNYRNTLIIEKDINEKLEPGTGSARLTLYTPNLISIKTTSDKNALLFLSDNYYPGWKATIDGGKSSIYRADYTFRAVLVPAGQHRVEFKYDPDSFKIGVYVAILGIIGIIGTIILNSKYQILKYK